MDEETMSRFALAVIAFFVFASGLLSEDVKDAGAYLDRALILKAAGEISQATYPDADMVLLDDYEAVVYNADGTNVTCDESYVKVLNEKGRRENQSATVRMNTSYEKTEFKAVEIIKPDGRSVPVDIGTMAKEMVDNSTMGMNIYDPNQKILSVNIPGVEVGDVVRVVYRQEVFKTRMPDTFSDYFGFESVYPIRHYNLEISAPEELPLRHKEIKSPSGETLKGAVEKKDGRIIYRWTAEDVPRMFPEPNMPDAYSLVQRLLVSTVKDWETVSKWCWGISEKHLEAVTPEMRKKTSELVEGIQDRQKRMEAVFYYVSRNIRYMGITIEKEAPGYEPHDVSITFENKYGVCRDKAALLVAMLRLAGFKAFPVLMMAGPKIDQDVPLPFFNHEVVCVGNDDGSYTLMDPTDENTKDIFPSYLGNMSYLVARPEGETLKVTPVVPADKNLVRVTTSAAFNISGGLGAETTFLFEGINDNIYRGYFARARPEEVKSYFEMLAKAILPGARLSELKIMPEKMGDTASAVSATIKYSTPDALVKGKDKMMLQLPWAGASVGLAGRVIGSTGLEKRKYPLSTEITCGVVEKFEVVLGGGIPPLAEMPEFQGVESDELEWARRLELKDGRIYGEGKFLLKTVEFSPEQYLVLRDTLKQIELDGRKMPIFGIAGEDGVEPGKEPDTEIIEQVVRCEIIDSGHWKLASKIREKVLTYSGIKKISEIKIQYNPIWDDVRLLSAKVVQPDGTENMISPKEINIMDQGWVSAAPRYPGGKILVASLPGVSVGSVIEYELSMDFKDRPFIAFDSYVRDNSPIRRKSFSLAYPEDMPLKVEDLITPTMPGVLEAGKGTLEFEVKDSPAIKSEPSLPPRWFFVPGILVSTGDWKSYCGVLRAGLEKKVADGAKAAARTVELVKAAGDDRRAKIKLIRDFVAVNVRTAGPGFNQLPLSCLSSADRTLEDGYGSSTDKAVLLAAMLKAAGIESEFVLASREPMIGEFVDMQQKIPDPDTFSELLVKIRGEDIYLNEGDQYAELGATYHAGFAGLFIGDAGIAEIKAAPDRKDRSVVNCFVKVSPDGTALVKNQTLHFGSAMCVFRRTFTEITPEDRRRHHLELCGSLSRSAKAAGEYVTRTDVYPGVEEYTVSIENYAVREGDYLYFELGQPLGGIFSNVTPGRENPYFIGSRSSSETNYYISLPLNEFKEQELIPPEQFFSIPSSGGESGSLKITRDTVKPPDCAGGFFGDGAGNVLKVSYAAELKPELLSKDSAKLLLSLNDVLNDPELNTIFIRK